MENPIKMDDLKVPQFSETSKSFDVWKLIQKATPQTIAQPRPPRPERLVERQEVGSLLKSAMMKNQHSLLVKC